MLKKFRHIITTVNYSVEVLSILAVSSSLPNGIYTYLSNFLLKILIGMDQEGKYDKHVQKTECAGVKRIQQAQ